MERDVDALIRNYRKRLEEQIEGFDSTGKALGQELRKLTEFFDPGPDRPMRVSQFLGFLDLSKFEDEFKKYYKHPWKIQYLEPMIKTIVFMVLENIQSPEGVIQFLKTHPEDALALGYRRLADGSVKLPSGQLIRYNIKERFKQKGLDEFFDLFVVEAGELLAQHGIHLGKNTGMDGMALEAAPCDKVAEFNDHYGIRGYKPIIQTDLDNYLPISKTCKDINGYEGSELIPHIRKARSLGMDPEETWVDGGYGSTENFAHAEVGESVKIHTTIQDHWKLHEECTDENLKGRYQKYHRHEGFIIRASRVQMMSFLVDHGNPADVEFVGNMVRNDTMLAYSEDTDGFMKTYHRRNITESMNNFIKYDMHLKDWLKRHKGLEWARLATSLVLFAVLAVALVRLQHGITENLTSVAGLA